MPLASWGGRGEWSVGLERELDKDRGAVPGTAVDLDRSVQCLYPVA